MSIFSNMEDVTPNRGSDAQGSPPPGDSFASGGSQSGQARPGNVDGLSAQTRNSSAPNISYTDASKSIPNEDPSAGYEPGAQAKAFHDAHTTVDEETPYQSSLGRAANFEDPYESQNAANFDDPEYLKGKQAPKRDIKTQLNQAAARGKAELAKRPTQYVGDKLLGDKHAFRGDTPENRERVKELAEKKIKDKASHEIGKRMGDQVAKKAFQEGLSKGSKAVAKEGIEKAGKLAAQAATKATTKAVAGAGAKAAVGVGQTAISGVGAASGAASFGLGLVLSFLLNIAISLFISDAIDAGFELKSGNFQKARFLAIRAAMKVGMFILLLVTLVSLISVGAWIIAFPLLIFINIYMVLGLLLKNFAFFQGLVLWEVAIVIMIDFLAFIILATFVAALGWWICDQSGLGGGTVSNVATSVYDWWNGSNYASTINEMCTSIKSF